MSNISQTERRLNDAHLKYQREVDSIKKLLQNHIDFSFDILYHESDGFCILDKSPNGANLAPMSDCLTVIESGTKLTNEIHKTLSI